MPTVDKPRVFLVTASLLFGGVYFAEVRQEHARASCQGQFNRAFTQSLAARSGPSDARVDALDALLGGLSVLVLHPPKTKADKARVDHGVQMLFGDYAKAAAALRRTKATAPLPVNTPKCGG